MSSLNLVLLALFVLIAPFILWPIEQIFPYPFIIEEVVKGIFVLNAFSIPNLKIKVLFVLMIGFLFALSENILYVFNIVTVGTMSFLFKRLILTSVLHITTTLVMFAWGYKEKRLVAIGFAIAVVIHYLFNFFVVESPR